MSWKERWQTYLPAVESAMQALLQPRLPGTARHYAMVAYHLGWRNEQLQKANVPAGKRLRPLLALLVTEAAGGDWHQVVQAAAAIELLHNLSLVHDDIEDNSLMRRHRPTVWSLWGRPQAINVGDSMFALVYEALWKLPENGVPLKRVWQAGQLFNEAIRLLTEGQYLDMQFESEDEVDLTAYLQMVSGKTAALLDISAGTGALLAGCAPACLDAYRRFGFNLGLAFQMEDDILGIWGDESKTGKSAATDILERKKTLPVLYAFARPEVAPMLHAIYHQTEKLSADQVQQVLALLNQVGAKAYTEAEAERYHVTAMAALDEVRNDRPAQADLRALATNLVGRQA